MIRQPSRRLLGALRGYENKYVLSAEAFGDPNVVMMAHRGWRHIHGISLNKAVYDMPMYHWNKYSYSDMRDTHYPDGMFDAVYNLEPDIDRVWAFAREARRILADRGVLVVDRSNEGSAELEGFALERREAGLSVMSIRKRLNPLPRRVSIVISPFKKFEGTYIQVEVMKERLEEQGVGVDLYRRTEDAPDTQPLIIEWEAGLNQPIPRERDNIVEAHTFISNYSNLEVILRKLRPGYLLTLMRPSTLYYYFKYYMIGGQRVGSGRPLDWTEFNKEMQRHFLLSRTYEMAENNHIENYVLAPHFNTKTTEQVEKEVLPLDTERELHIGTCGHAAASKHFEDIAELAIRLDVRATIMGSHNELHEGSIKETSSYARKIFDKYDGANNGKVRVLIGQWSYEQLTEKLRECTHVVSAQDQARSVSNSMRFMVSVGRPLISVENYQARECQAIRVNSLSEVDRGFLERTRTQLTNLDDGLRYYLLMLRMFNRGGRWR